MSNGRGSGGGSIGVKGDVSSYSMKEKAAQAVSSLVKVAASILGGVKAVFSEIKADGADAMVQPPGMKQREVENKTPKQLVNEQIRLRDILKIFGLKALALALNNPIPLVFAQRIEKNMEERAKAKQKELEKQLREAKKQEKVQKRKTLEQKYDAAVNQVKTLQQQLKVMQKEASLAQKQMGNNGVGKQQSDTDKKNIGFTKTALVKMGFKASDATNIINSALSKGSSPSDLSKLIGDSLKEADSYKKNS